MTLLFVVFFFCVFAVCMLLFRCEKIQQGWKESIGLGESQYWGAWKEAWAPNHSVRFLLKMIKVLFLYRKTCGFAKPINIHCIFFGGEGWREVVLLFSGSEHRIAWYWCGRWLFERDQATVHVAWKNIGAVYVYQNNVFVQWCRQEHVW